MELRQVDTARGSFGVRVAGPEDGPVLLCVHGFPDDAGTWDGVGAALAARGYRVVAPYLRGYHPSPLEGDLGLAALTDDLAGVLEAVDARGRAFYMGHDYGSQIGYDLLTRYGGRFVAAVMLAGAHPANIARTVGRHPRQWWMSRYILGFQLKGLAEARVRTRDFRHLETLWRRWSPGLDPTPHMGRVKATFRRSMPHPIRMYRAGGFDIGERPIATPTLFVAGGADGCLLPALGDGQERLFKGGYERRVLAGVGHWPHLERSDLMTRWTGEWFERYGGGANRLPPSPHVR
ncbi:alpha/beta fold hydrolase [Sphingomonas lenta]|uniref:AB hydrolase-1 domain-containing protein n=1 Tax=Sphingomonas lenta TaxID=1141887 RepID=A0A2A2SD85_9SPHN|nr:alpha/beta fold hydrolase [Sphingomonas lenta]PAX07142.1 hypothetical protein CKY28_13955 [Sphingomonas lenta]